MKRHLGFSLIELLIALAIMSMTLLISSLGFSFFMEKWQGNLGHFDSSTKIAKKMLLTRRAISGIAPYVLTDKDKQNVIYFEGNQDSLVGVTNRAFFNSDLPSVFKLKVVQQSDFSFSLIYEEASLKDEPLISLTQKLNFNNQVTLLSNLSDIKLSYYGFKDQDAQVANTDQQWWQSFNSLSRKMLPSIIKMSFIFNGKEEQFSFPIAQVDPRILVLFNDSF